MPPRRRKKFFPTLNKHLKKYSKFGSGLLLVTLIAVLLYIPARVLMQPKTSKAPPQLITGTVISARVPQAKYGNPSRYLVVNFKDGSQGDVKLPDWAPIKKGHPVELWKGENAFGGNTYRFKKYLPKPS